MIKNFSPHALGINGRQSELIELALTYAFGGMDIDMSEMHRRSQRSSPEDAAKYLNAAKIKVGGFSLDIDLDADDETFTSQVGTLHPLADLAKQFGVKRCYLNVPAATNRLPYHEFFEVQRTRLTQIAEALQPRDIQLGIGFRAGKDLGEGKEFDFVRNTEGFIALVSGISAPNAGYMIDTWDWVVGGGAMDQISELDASKIIYVRLGSVPAEVDHATAKTSDRALPEQTGMLDHVRFVKHLADNGFEGPICPSCSSSQYKGQTRESIVQRAQEAVDGISKAAGLHVAPLPMDLIEDIPYEPNPVG